MRQLARPYPTDLESGVGVAPDREEGKGLEVSREWQDALERVSLASCQGSAPESQFLAQEEIPPLLLVVYSSGRVARLLTTITAVVASHVLTLTTRHLTPRILSSHGILPMLQPLMGDPPDVLRTPWSSTRHHRRDDSP